MPHVSKKPVEERWLPFIEELLVAVLLSPQSLRERRRILGEVLSDTERMMLGKRVALLSMEAAGFSSYTIAKRLAVHWISVRKFKKRLAEGKYDSVRKRIGELARAEASAELLGTMLRGGLPPITGKRTRPTLLQKRRKL